MIAGQESPIRFAAVKYKFAIRCQLVNQLNCNLTTHEISNFWRWKCLTQIQWSPVALGKLFGKFFQIRLCVRLPTSVDIFARRAGTFSLHTIYYDAAPGIQKRARAFMSLSPSPTVGRNRF